MLSPCLFLFERYGDHLYQPVLTHSFPPRRSSDLSFLNAMIQQESSGNSRAVNQHTGALGLWQVLPSNVTPWAKRYLGMNISPNQFLKDRKSTRLNSSH